MFLKGMLSKDLMLPASNSQPSGAKLSDIAVVAVAFRKGLVLSRHGHER